MDLEYFKDQYKFVMTKRDINFKRIQRTRYDRIVLDVYKRPLLTEDEEEVDYTKVATIGYYYATASKNIRRYVTLYDEEGNAIIDFGHLQEYNLDQD